MCYCYWDVIAFRPSQLTELENICVHTNVYLYIQEEKGTTEDEMVDDITNSMDMSLSKLWEIVKDRETCCVHGVTKSQTRLSD